MHLFPFVALLIAVLLSWYPAQAEEVTLSPDIRTFLDHHPQVRVRMNGDWPPLLFSENGASLGITADYLKVIAAKLGISLVPVDMRSFGDVLTRLPTGDGLDIQPILRATDERRASIHFSRPYVTYPVVIITRAEYGYVGSLEDLAGKTVTAERNYWYTTEIRDGHPSLALRLFDTSQAAIRAVAEGEAEAYVGILPVAVWHMENRGYTNLKVAAPSGLSAAELSFGVRGDWPELAQALDAALDSITAEEHRAIRQHWLSARYDYGLSPRTVLIWGGGSLAVVLVVLGGFALANRRLIREIALRREAEAQLRTSEATSRQLLDASSDACMLLDLDGTMRGCNQIFADRFGLDPALVPGTSLWRYFPPDVTAGRKAAVARVVAKGIPETITDSRDGRHFSNSIYPLKDASGIVRRIAVYSRDISEQVWAEQRIKSYVAEIERSNEDLEQFAYVASHDLREPLRQVSSYVTLLDRRYADQLDADARQFIAYAREGVNRMDQLILDLLEFSRIGRNLALVPVSAAKAAAIAADNLKTAVAETGGAIDIAGDLPEVLAAEQQLIRLFQNLMGNGLKYHRKDIAPRIRLSARSDDDTGMVTFSVADNGIGIETEYFERIFGIFQRLHGRTDYPGTGIGLAVCRKIVERHGGHIWLDSVPGQGTCFHFSLRAAPASPQNA